jgi:hypothetical protein
MILTNPKLAKFAGKPLGTILSDDEGVALMRAYRQHGKAVANARFAEAAKTAPDFSRIVTKTWERGGLSLHRGDVVYVKTRADGLGAAMVTRSKSRTAQGMVWTCGMDEVREHTIMAQHARGNVE